MGGKGGYRSRVRVGSLTQWEAAVLLRATGELLAGDTREYFADEPSAKVITRKVHTLERLDRKLHVLLHKAIGRDIEKGRV